MSADLKPEGVAKKKPKKVAAKEKPQPKAKAKFLVKKHKRAGKGEMADWLYCCAIHDNLKNKQVAQLSSKFENYEQMSLYLMHPYNPQTNPGYWSYNQESLTSTLIYTHNLGT